MKRYVTLAHKPKSADIYAETTLDAENYLSREVYEPERTVKKSGILDASGNDIYCIEEMEPIGFVRWEA